MANGWTVVGKIGGSGDENKSDKGWTVVGKVSNTVENQIDPLTTHQPIKFGTGGRVINGADKDFKNVVKGNPIPHVNPTAISSNSFGKEKALAGIRSKLQKGEVLTTFELQQVDMFGGMSEVAGNNQKFIFDISARDNPSNTALWNAAKSAMDKEINGIKLTEEENNAISTYKLIDEFNKSLAKYNSSLTEDTNLNRQKQVSAKAQGLYNDSAYDDNHVNLGNKEITVDKSDKFSSFAGKVQKQENRLDLYMNTGFAQYGEGVNTTLELLTAFVSGKEMSDVTNRISNRPDGAYSVASGILKQYYQENGERLNSVVQDVVTNMANNLPAMAVSLAGGAMGMSAWITSALSQGLVFAPSVFGNAYKEGTKFGVTDPTKLFCYATAITAAETGLGYLLDGVTGAATKGLADNVSKSINNVILKTIYKGVIRGGGEFLEESTQSVLSPLLQSWILDADVDTILTDPIESLKGAAYEGFIGMLSAWIMGGVGDFGSAVNESQIQQYGNYCIDIMSKTDTDIKDVAAYLMKVNEKKSDVYKAAEKVSKGDSSSFAVGDMMNKAAIAAKESQNFLYATIGKSIKEKPNGITQVIDTFESLKKDGLIFPSKVEDLYLGIKDTISTGVDIKNEIIGEFAVSVQTYSPRAIIMRDLVKTIENEKSDIDTESDYNNNNAENNRESVFTEYSAEAPESDLVADYMYKTEGKQRLSDDQLKIAHIANKLGRKVVFENIENGADGFIDTNGIIHISYNNVRPVEFIFKHELSHFAEGSELYNQFVATVKSSKAFEKWISQRVSGKESLAHKTAVARQEIIELYAQNGVNISAAEAENELIADFVGENLFNSDGSGLEAIMSDMTSPQRKTFSQYIKDFIAYIKQKISRTKQGTADIAKLEKMFNEVLSTVEQKNTADNSGVRYSFFDSNVEVLSMINKVKSGNFKANEKVYFENVSDELATKITQLTGVDVKGFKVAIEARQIEHILKDHGENGKTDHSMSNDEDIAKIEYVLNNAEEINKSGKTQAYTYTKNGYNKTADTIKYQKSIGNKMYYVVQAVADTKAKTLYIVTAYIENQSIKNEVSQLINANSPDATSEDGSVVTSNDNIAQNENTVNSNDMQKSEKNSNIRYSIPTDQASLLDKYENGEITREEYLEQTNENWGKANETFGIIKQGEKAVMPIAVPKAVETDKNTERFIRTIIETGEVKGELLENISTELLLGNFSYKPISDESAQAKADDIISKKMGNSVWNEAVHSSKYIGKNEIAVGEKLLLQAIADNNKKRVIELSAELAEVLTRGGQVVQASRMLKKMSGVGKLITVQKMVDNINKDLRTKYKDKAPTVQLDALIAQQLGSLKIGEDMESIYNDAIKDIASQVPATFLDKWNAWRYMSMLTNPTTHIRNIVGNAIFTPSVRMKYFVSAMMENGFVEENSRSKAVIIGSEYKAFAEKDVKNSVVIKALKSGGKFNVESEVSEQQRIFKNGVLEFLRTFNSNLLEAEDLIFKNIHYKHALAGFLQARKVNLNAVSEEILWEARIYAVEEAMKATFNDANRISSALTNAARSNQELDVAINGILPFKKTPINIVRRGVEYSPLGLCKTLTKGIYDLKKGKITATEFIDGLGAGISGSVPFAIGMLLASLGYVTGGFGSDDEDNFKKLNGEQEYALQLFGKSYTIDWAAPACIPFFMGVELMNALKTEREDFKLSDITDVMWNSLEPIVNLSMLSGVQSMIESVKYAAEDKSLISFVGNIGKSYFAQALPTIFGKVARTFDSKRRQNYIDKNSQLSSYAQGIINTVKSKVPALENTKPEYVNAWGETESNGNVFERVFGNFVSPGYYSKVEYDEISNELIRLNAAVDDAHVFPKNADKSFKVNGETKYLTADEYVKFAKAKGKWSLKYVCEFIEDGKYDKLTDEQRADVIENLYEYANAKAKTEISDYDITKSYKTVYNLDKNGKSPVLYYIGKALSKN